MTSGFGTSTRRLRTDRRALLGSLAVTLFSPVAGRAGVSPSDHAPLERRIVALDSIAVSLLASLEIVPVAACMAFNYRPGSADVALSPGVRDIGLAIEPNLELLSSLEPDLLLSGWPVGNKAVLEQIAPVMALDLYKGQADAYAALDVALRGVAVALGRTPTAEAAIASCDAVIAGCANRLRAADRLPAIYLTDLGFGAGRLGIYGSHSLADAVARRMGLRNAWHEPDQPWGWSTISAARLAEDADAVVVWKQRHGASGISIGRRLLQSQLWRNLPAAEDGGVIVLPPTDLFGGLQTASKLAGLLSDALSGRVAG